jgi:hypothetical protein
MARNQEVVNCLPKVWTELTNSDAVSITFQVQSGAIKVRATTGAAPSSLADGGYIYHAHATGQQTEEGELRILLSDLTATAGADRVFATPIDGRPSNVIVDHA